MKKGDRIKAELETLRGRFKLIRPQTVVEWARTHPKSALHSRLEWRDTKAAHEYRLWQARQLLTVYCVDVGGAPELISLSIDRSKSGGGYRFVNDVLSSQELSRVMLIDAIRDLEVFELKYRRVEGLTAVWKALRAIKKKRP